jgi:chromosome segregation ATPase
MRSPIPSALLALPLVLAIASPRVSAQIGPLEGASPSEIHLAEISSNLARIADLLESQAESRRLDLAMRRVDLRQRRLEPLEARLRLARASRDSDAEEQFRLRSQLENVADRFASGTLDIDADEISTTTDYLASELELTNARLRSTNDEIAAFENEVSEYRDEIEGWEDWIDRELSGL